jgi:alpha-glucosidase
VTASRTSLASLHHDGSGRYVVPLAGADPVRLHLGDEVRLRVRAAPDAPIERLFLRTTPDGEQRFEELREVAPGPACRWWEIAHDVRMPTTSYRFLVLTPDGHRWLNGSGVHVATPTDRDDFVLLAGFDPPHWAADRVFYQIFPERFANGDPSNDPADGAWTYRGQAARRRRWDELPGSGPGAMVEFFGGDLQGIEAHLDHLTDLGVDAVYLNPIFRTFSNHGYDTVDYDHVADHLGGDDGLVSLRRATRERDIRLILDIAPNHVGAEHPWFQAAQADPGAETADRFVFRAHPDDYESWLGVRSLPKLDYRSAALRDAMYAGPAAILTRWLRPPFEVDGWRIDVANMLGRLGADQLGHDVARSIRAAVKAASPEAYLIGEHWFDAIDQLAGDQWDGVMDYAGFTQPVLDWLEGITFESHGTGTVFKAARSSTATFVETRTAFRAAIAWQVAVHQLNLIGSHDTARIRTVLGDDDGRVRAAFGLLLTYVGVPSIYYGDEVGLGGADPIHARQPMPWDPGAWDQELQAFVRTLVGVRHSSPALRRGGFQVLEVGDGWLAYLRDTDDEQVIVVAVRGPDARPAGMLSVRPGAIPDGSRFAEVLTGAGATVVDGALPLPVTPTGTAIWRSDGTPSR